MKKMTVMGSVLFVGMIVTPASAQTSVGLVGGTNLSKYVSRAEATYSRRGGFAVGGVVDFTLSEAVHVRLEPMYIQKGGAAEDAALREEMELEASALEVPMLLSVGFGTSTTRPYVLAGPTLGVMLTTSLAGSDSGVSFEGDIMDVTKRFDLGVAVGAGVSHRFQHLTAFLEGRHVWGATNLMKGGEVVLSAPELGETGTVTFDREENEYKYRGLQILFGVTISVGS